MDFIPGTDLQKTTTVTHISRKDDSQQADQRDSRRTTNNTITGLLWKLERHALHRWCFLTPDNNPIISEPFEDQEQMNQGILEKPGQTQSPHYIRLLQEMVNRTLKNHRIVFTRGGLQPKNIMERREIYDNGSADFKVTLIDWNLSGCYAKFWDFLQFNIVLSNETGLARARSRHNLICTRWNIS